MDSDCTFYSVWQVAALSNFSECEKREQGNDKKGEEEEENKHSFLKEWKHG